MKKLLLTLSSISLTVMPSLNIISCQTDIDDEDYFIPTEQPKNIEEIEISTMIYHDKSEDLKIELTELWSEHKIKVSFDDMSKEEQEIERIKFHVNSEKVQKEAISRFWVGIYGYKISQFDENYINERITEKDRKIKIEAQSKDYIDYSLKSLSNNEFYTLKTKEHVEKIYNWAIMENPNIKK